MQNIMTFAHAERITAKEIEKITGVDRANLTPNGLAKYPHPLGTMTKQQADEAIARVAPFGVPIEFQKLKGYPEPTIDAALQKLIEQFPEDKAMQSLEGYFYGDLFRFNRKQRQRGGKDLAIKDCIVKGMGTAAFSRMERGIYSPPQSVGLAALQHLGHPADAAGLEAFCRETAALMEAHELRSLQFQRALHAHMYPEGNMKNRRLLGQTVRVQQGDIVRAINSSCGKVTDLIHGTYVPTEAEVQAILPLFHAANEQEFYANADKIYAANPNLTPPTRRSTSAAMAHFGRLVKAVREELSISQPALQWLAQGNEEPALPDELLYNVTISQLETGKRRLPLPEHEQLDIIDALGCTDESKKSKGKFELIAGQVQKVRRYREKYFSACLQILVDWGNKVAIDLAEDKHYTPLQARKVCEALRISEADLYRGTLPEPPAEILTACDEVAQFVADFNYARYLPIGGHHIGNERVGRRGRA